MAHFFTTTTELLVDASARALLLAALAAVVLRCWPAGNANFQHRAWTAVLWGMLLLPVLTQFTAALSLLPSGWRWEPPAVAAQSIAVPQEAIVVMSRTPAPAAPSDRADERAEATEPGDWVESPAPRPLDSAGGLGHRDRTADASVAGSPPVGGIVDGGGKHQASARSEATAVGWTGVIAALYLCGVALLAIRLALGYLAVRRLVRRAADIPGLSACRARVAASDAVRMPVTAGLLRPVILLPADWSRWSPALLSSVVAHEQAHVERRDHLVLLASEVNRCLYWFHPVAWFLGRRLSALAEQCCDDAVIAALRSRGDYARHLLEIAGRLKSDRGRLAPLAISMARSSRVESRIVAILDERRPLAGRIGRGGALALAVIVGPLVLLAAGLRAADPPPQKPQAAAAKPAATAAAETTVQPEPNAAPESKAQAEANKPAVKGVLLRGRVVLASDGSPAVGAEVRLQLKQADWHPIGVRRAKTDERGIFVFDDVPPGPHHLLVAVLDGLASRRERAQVAKIEVAADHPPEPVELKLWPAPTIAVHVKSKADGAPLAGAQVWLADAWWEEKTDAQGNVLLLGLTPEVWRVRVHAEGFAAQMIPLKLEGDQRAELNFALEPGGTIHGTVKDQSGKPLADIQVGVRFSGDPYELEETRTDAEGRYQIDFLPLDQELEVASGGEPYLRTRRTTRVPAQGGRGVEVNLALERRPVGGSVQGVVTDQAGVPITGATLTNRGNSSRDVHEATADAAGRFRLDDVMTSFEGAFVVVRAKGFAPQAVPLDPGPADKPTEITVKLEPGHRIRGRVLDATGKPIAGVRIKYGRGGIFEADSLGGDAKTDSEGRFEFDSLPADCPFDFSAKGYSPIDEAELALDGEQEVTVTLQPQGVIRGGVVHAATGEPVTKFRVRIRHSPDRKPDDPKGGLSGSRVYEGEQFTAADGQFVLDDLKVGLPLELLVDANGFGTASMRRVLPRPEGEAEVVEIKVGPTDPAKIGDIAGTIVDERGQATAGAQVRLVVREPDPDRHQDFKWRVMTPARIKEGIPGLVQFLSTVSGADGSFRFDRVRLDKDIELVWWGEGVSEGEMPHLEKLPPAQLKAMRIESPTPGAIQGKVNRQALPNLREISATGWDTVDFPEGSTKADYLIRNLRPGRYELEVRVPATPTNKKGRGPLKTIQSQMVTIEGGKTLTVDIGFETDPGPGASSPASARPTGRASTARAATKPRQPINEPADEEAVLSGRVVDDQGKPVADALVILPLGFARAPAEPAQPQPTQTDAAGQFSFRIPRGRLPADEVAWGPTVWAYAPGHALAFLSVRDQLEQRPPGEIELVVGPATDTAFRIVDPAGKPVAGARVVPRQFKAGAFAPPEEIAAIIDGTSDADGLARLPAIDRNGWQMLLVKAAGFGEQSVRSPWGDADMAPTTTIPLRPVGRLEVKVTGDGSERVAGPSVWVRTVEWGKPFSGLPLGLPRTEGHTAGTTNEDGGFIAPELAVGEARLDVTVDQQQPLRPQVPKEIKIIAGQTTRVEVPLVKAQRVRGLVRSKADGKPVANTSVTMHHLGGGTPHREQVRTDAEGRFEAYALPGEVVLHVGKLPGLMQERDRNRPQRRQTVAAQEGVFELKPIEMVAAKTIVGRLVDQFDHPLAGVIVMAGDGPGRGIANGRTDSDGSFSLELPADAEPSYEVRAELRGAVDADIVQADPLVLRADGISAKKEAVVRAMAGPRPVRTFRRKPIRR